MPQTAAERNRFHSPAGCGRMAARMQTIHVLILAVVQGLTEFLPVSSSGHLVLAQRALGAQAPGPDVELFLHLGTLVSVCVFFRRRLLALAGAFFRGRREGLLYALWVVLSALPAALKTSASESVPWPSAALTELALASVRAISLASCRLARPFTVTRIMWPAPSPSMAMRCAIS